MDLQVQDVMGIEAGVAQALFSGVSAMVGSYPVTVRTDSGGLNERL